MAHLSACLTSFSYHSPDKMPSIDSLVSKEPKKPMTVDQWKAFVKALEKTL